MGTSAFCQLSDHSEKLPERTAGKRSAGQAEWNKRCDTVAYNRFLEPLVIVEYKAPHINITNTVFDQIARYNMVLRVEYLIVSNGLNHYCCKIDYNNRAYTFLEGIPAYNEL